MANLYKLEAKFGKVSFGDKTASVTMQVPLDDISPAKLHKDICTVSRVPSTPKDRGKITPTNRRFRGWKTTLRPKVSSMSPA